MEKAEKIKKDKIQAYIAEAEVYRKEDKFDRALLALAKALSLEITDNEITLTIKDLNYILHWIQYYSYIYKEWRDVLTYGDLCGVLAPYEKFDIRHQDHLYWRSVAFSNLGFYAESIELIDQLINSWRDLWGLYSNDEENKNNLLYSKLRKFYYDKAMNYNSCFCYEGAISNFSTALCFASKRDDICKILSGRIHAYTYNKQYAEAKNDCDAMIEKSKVIKRDNYSNMVELVTGQLFAKEETSNIESKCYLTKAWVCWMESTNYHYSRGKWNLDILQDILELTQKASDFTKEMKTAIDAKIMRLDTIVTLCSGDRTQVALMKEGLHICSKLKDYYDDPNNEDDIVVPKFLNEDQKKKWDIQKLREYIQNYKQSIEDCL